MSLFTPHSISTHGIRDVVNHPCPISTLPTELLQEIFAFSMTKKPWPRMHSTVSWDELYPPGFQATALILTWVCSQWRQIALYMPELWATMIIYGPKGYCAELAKVYLSRSGNTLPLNLYLRQDPALKRAVDTGPEHDATVDVLRLWVPQAHRWRSIHLDLSYTSPLHELPKISPGALSNVQQAELHFHFTERDDTMDQWLWGHIFQSPALRTAYWRGPSRRLPAAPFTQLAEFRVLCALDEFLSIIASCQRLKHIRASISSKTTQPINLARSIITLPTLEYLSLDVGVDEHATSILGQICAPALRELEISDTSATPFAQAHTLEEFLHHSGCTLRALRLHLKESEDETNIIDYFSNASKYLAKLEVCSLSMTFTMFSGRVLSLFTPRTVDDTVFVPFPVLVDLEIEDVVTEDGMISSMVESRFAAGAPLWAFVCHVGDGPLNSTGYSKDEGLLKKLQCQNGLQLDWEYLTEEH